MKKLPLIGAIITVFFLMASQASAQSIRDYPSPLEACRYFLSQGGFTITRNFEHDCTVRNGSNNAFIYTHFYDTGSNFCLEITSSIGRIYGPECMLISQTGRAQQQQQENPTKLVTPPSFQIKELQYDTLPSGKPVVVGDKEMVEIEMPDGSKITLDKNATFTPVSDHEVHSVFGRYRYLWQPFHDGKCIVGQNLVRQDCRKIKTPHAIIGDKGTEFLVDSIEAGTTVTVIEGSVSVADLNMKKTVEVNAGQFTYIKKNGLPDDPKPYDPEKIDNWWLKQNQKQLVQEAVKIIIVFVLLIIITALIVQWKNLFGNKSKQKTADNVKAVAGIDGPVIVSFAFGLYNIILGVSDYLIFRIVPDYLTGFIGFFAPGVKALSSQENGGLFFLILGIVGLILSISGMRSSHKIISILSMIFNLAAILIWGFILYF